MPPNGCGCPARRVRSSSRRSPWTIRGCVSPRSRARRRSSLGNRMSGWKTACAERSMRWPPDRPRRLHGGHGRGPPQRRRDRKLQQCGVNFPACSSRSRQPSRDKGGARSGPHVDRPVGERRDCSAVSQTSAMTNLWFRAVQVVSTDVDVTLRDPSGRWMGWSVSPVLQRRVQKWGSRASARKPRRDERELSRRQLQQPSFGLVL